MRVADAVQVVAEHEARAIAACVDRDQVRADLDAKRARLDAELARVQAMTDEEFEAERQARGGQGR